MFRFYINAYEDRDTTVGEGFFINEVHFDVHRFHPPLVYGRRGGPEDGEGIALCRFKPREVTEVQSENISVLVDNIFVANSLGKSGSIDG